MLTLVSFKKLTRFAEVKFMPLTMANIGEQNTVKRISGKDDTRSFLEKLGFVAGAPVTIISHIAGNVIVNVCDTRVAVSRDMANRIMV